MKDLKKSYSTVMDDSFPEDMTISFGGKTLQYKKRTWKIDENGKVIEKGLRYGENPGQEAALYELVNGNLTIGECEYISPGNSLVSGINESDMIQFGKHPGKINLTDIDSCLNILKYLTKKPSCVIVKHNNPCGVAQAENGAEAFSKALMSDRIAAFGGCIGINTTLDRQTAELISQSYFEVVAAPEFTGDAVEVLKSRKNLRIVQIKAMSDLSAFANIRFLEYKSLIDGGLIVQQNSINTVSSIKDLEIASTVYKDTTYTIDRKPTENEYEDMIFGWAVEQGVTSNSVIYVKDGVTAGIGTGEQDRVGVAEIAVSKAYTKYRDRITFEKYGKAFTQLELEINKGEADQSLIKSINEIVLENRAGLKGSCMVSDAFFPFRDGLDVGIKEKISSVIQPGGSIRDFESIVACNEADPKVTMVFTGQRAFKH
jgi:phosphoribosylaminoimidazolecarboxamide formyltransferase/IMP cyclohydrolase